MPLLGQGSRSRPRDRGGEAVFDLVTESMRLTESDQDGVVESAAHQVLVHLLKEKAVAAEVDAERVMQVKVREALRECRDRRDHRGEETILPTVKDALLRELWARTRVKVNEYVATCTEGFKLSVCEEGRWVVVTREVPQENRNRGWRKTLERGHDLAPLVSEAMQVASAIAEPGLHEVGVWDGVQHRIVFHLRRTDPSEGLPELLYDEVFEPEVSQG